MLQRYKRINPTKKGNAMSSAAILTHRRVQSTESPILFRSCPHCGHETPFSDQNDASKIGDSVLWSCHCVRLYFVNPSCKYVTKIQTHRSDKKQRIVVSLRAFAFCKPILQICYKDTNASFRQKATHRRVTACVCIL